MRIIFPAVVSLANVTFFSLSGPHKSSTYFQRKTTKVDYRISSTACTSYGTDSTTDSFQNILFALARHSILKVRPLTSFCSSWARKTQKGESNKYHAILSVTISTLVSQSFGCIYPHAASCLWRLLGTTIVVPFIGSGRRRRYLDRFDPNTEHCDSKHRCNCSRTFLLVAVFCLTLFAILISVCISG
jgi:hypothetical protein